MTSTVTAGRSRRLAGGPPPGDPPTLYLEADGPSGQTWVQSYPLPANQISPALLLKVMPQYRAIALKWMEYTSQAIPDVCTDPLWLNPPQKSRVKRSTQPKSIQPTSTAAVSTIVSRKGRFKASAAATSMPSGRPDEMANSDDAKLTLSLPTAHSTAPLDAIGGNGKDEADDDKLPPVIVKTRVAARTKKIATALLAEAQVRIQEDVQKEQDATLKLLESSSRHAGTPGPDPTFDPSDDRLLTPPSPLGTSPPGSPISSTSNDMSVDQPAASTRILNSMRSPIRMPPVIRRSSAIQHPSAPPIAIPRSLSSDVPATAILIQDSPPPGTILVPDTPPHHSSALPPSGTIHFLDTPLHNPPVLAKPSSGIDNLAPFGLFPPTTGPSASNVIEPVAPAAPAVKEKKKRNRQLDLTVDGVSASGHVQEKGSIICEDEDSPHQDMANFPTDFSDLRAALLRPDDTPTIAAGNHGHMFPGMTMSSKKPYVVHKRSLKRDHLHEAAATAASEGHNTIMKRETALFRGGHKYAEYCGGFVAQICSRTTIYSPVHMWFSPAVLAVVEREKLIAWVQEFNDMVQDGRLSSKKKNLMLKQAVIQAAQTVDQKAEQLEAKETELAERERKLDELAMQLKNEQEKVHLSLLGGSAP